MSVRKTLAGGVAVVLSLGLAACGGDSTTGGESASSAGAEPAQSTSEESATEAVPEESSESAADGDLFTVPEYNFAVAIPGEPAVTPLDQSTEGVDITGNLYITEVSDIQGYMAGVSHYELTSPDLTWDDRASLDGAIEGMVTNVNGSVVSSSNDGEFLGYPSGDVVFEVPEGGDANPFRSKVFMRDMTLFQLTSYGLSDDEFADYVNSFTFLD